MTTKNLIYLKTGTRLFSALKPDGKPRIWCSLLNTGENESCSFPCCHKQNFICLCISCIAEQSHFLLQKNSLSNK
jgi:hypothetical protein